MVSANIVVKAYERRANIQRHQFHHFTTSPISPISTIPSMGTMRTMELTNSQPQFHQSQLIIPPQMQSMMHFNRSQFMITTPPAQQFYSHSPFVSRVTRQMIPSHMMAGAPQTLTPPQMLTPQMVSPPMVSPHCFGVPQYHRF